MGQDLFFPDELAKVRRQAEVADCGMLESTLATSEAKLIPPLRTVCFWWTFL